MTARDPQDRAPAAADQEAEIRAFLAERGIPAVVIELAVGDWRAGIPLHIDFESASRTDLTKEGAWKYATCPSTEILMMGWAFGDEKPELWWMWPEWRAPLPDRVRARFLICSLGYGRRLIHCHNSQFERWMTWFILCPELDLPEPTLDSFYCTAAQARRRSLPGALDDLGRALDLTTRKDRRGKDLIKALSVPQKDGTFNRDPVLMREFGDYCLTDVEVERAAAKLSFPLTDEEFEDFVVSEEINDVGLRIDVEFAKAVQAYASQETAAINEELLKLTNGRVRTARSFQKIKKWLEPYREGNDFVRRATTRVKTVRGVEERKVSIDKAARHNILSFEEDELGSIPGPVLDLVSLLDEAGRTSIHKFKAMALRADPEDDRVRGAYMWCGASQTARFSSTGLQLHNWVREVAPEPLTVRAQVLAGEDLLMSAKKLEQGKEETILDILASMLRPSIIAAPNRRLVWGDWSGIEARVLPWLTADERAQPLLDIYAEGDAYERATGEKRPPHLDPYVITAAKIFKIPVEEVTEDQRQSGGKVPTLSLQYQGWVKALQAMGRNHGVRFNDDHAVQIARAWRDTNEWCTRFWRKVETAALRAVRHPGEYFDAGRLRYVSTVEPYPILWALSPSGSTLTYPMVRIENRERFGETRATVTAIKAAWKPAADATDWPRVDLYGGQLAENGCQHVATSEILKAALRRLRDADWPVVMHTHDECVLEVYADEVSEAAVALGEAMLAREPWMEGLPLWVDIASGPRYKMKEAA